MSAHPQTRLTAEQYLEIERSSDVRSEYYAGAMYAMSGGSYRHAQIIANLSAELRAALKRRPCSVTSSDVRLQVSPNGLITYPDIAVVCGEPRFADHQRDTLLNPTLLVEVLSPSIEAYDRGFKFAQYRTLEALQEYVLVSQDEPRLEVFRRQPESEWLLHETTGLDAVCRFTSVEVSIPLAEIYDKVVFPEAEGPQPRTAAGEQR